MALTIESALMAAKNRATHVVRLIEEAEVSHRRGEHADAARFACTAVNESALLENDLGDLMNAIGSA
jgi:hypothetical protein